MSKTIPLYGRLEKKRSFLSTIVRGTPSEFEVLGRKVQLIGPLYEMRKMQEFYDSYWESFVQGLNDINPSQEFNSDYVKHRFNSLSTSEQALVQRDCAKIYAFHDKLTYGQFTDVVNSYLTEERIASEPSLTPDDSA